MVRGRLVEITSGFPRRNNLSYLTQEEQDIFDDIQNVEMLCAHPLLTDVVVLLQQARDKLSDYIDLNYPSEQVVNTQQS